jgi:uncharacterized protein YfaS (alpha-2-macroglobulin family)
VRTALKILAVVATVVVAGCVDSKPSGPAPLALGSPAPEPTLASPIVSIAPRGVVDTLDQIRVRFAGDLIPLSALESPAENAALSHFHMEPALPGHFRFFTPKLVGFEADAALPLATRVRVTVTAGLTDVARRALGSDVTWSFETHGVSFEDLPGKNVSNAKSLDPSPLHPTIAVVSNVALDRSSVTRGAKLVSRNGKETVGLTFLPAPQPSASDSPGPAEAFDPSQRNYRYTLVPVHDLAKATLYDIVIGPGILPRDGNLPTNEAITGALQTYEPLRFGGVSPSVDPSSDDPGRFSAGAPVLSFNNPITAASARTGITISPAPRDATHLIGISDDGDQAVTINPDLLAPNTDYTITVAHTVTDTFGQTLASDAHVKFHTGDLSAAVWAPSGKVIFPASRRLALNIVSTNVAKGRAAFHKLQPADLVTNDGTYGLERSGLLPDESEWPALTLGGSPNIEKTTAIPLREKLGGATGVLAYGIGAKMRHQDYTAYGLVQLTDIGVFAQWFPDSGFVRVHRLSDGSPIAMASIDIYPSRTSMEKNTQTPAICAHAVSGADGIATFDRAAFARCAATDNGKGDAPPFLAVARSGADWAYVRTESYDGAYLPSMYNGWSSMVPQSRGTIFSDRDLYQPGETLHATGIGWFLIDGALARGHAPGYTVTLASPSGVKRELGRVSLNAYGTFTQTVALPKDAELGYWSIHAAAGTGEELYGSFRVAEFKPPNFKVDLALDAMLAERGQSVTASANSQYLFGAPVDGAKSVFTVTRAPADLAPAGRDAYTFGRHWYWPEQQPNATTDVAQMQTRVDGNGKSASAVTVANDLPYPMTYRVDAETTDVSNLSVADSKSFTALPSTTLIGLKTNFVGTAGVPLDVAVITTDFGGKAISGVHVTLVLQRADYASATALVEGSESATSAVQYTTVASADVTTTPGDVTAHLTPPKAGTYRVRANVSGAKDDATATDTEVWVAGDTSIAWTQQDPNVLAVQLDKPTYAIGDVARALIASPFPKGDLYVAVVRHGIMWKKIQAVEGAAPEVRFTVTADMLPNAAVEAVIVRRGAAPATTPAGSGNVFARSGFASFNVDLAGKYVKITATPLHASMAPGGKQEVRLHVTDARGKPLRAQLTVIVANDAVLQLSGYRPPDLVKLVYEAQPISTRFSDNRTDVALTTPERPFEKGFGYGGGLSSGNADTRVRRAFSALASFTGSLVTDAGGNAHVAFTLPDDLTTWRVMAVAATPDGRFGNAEAQFIATKPLLANPVVPQFARPGDRFDAGVAVTNPAKRSGTINVAGTLAGPLAFVTGSGGEQADIALHAPADPLTHAYRFSMIAGYAGTATATFHVMLGAASDAFAIPVPVIDRSMTESVITTGTTTGAVSIPLDVAANIPNDTGGLDVVLANTMLPDILAGANSVLDGDELYAEAIAGRLSIAADLIRLARDGVETPGTEPRARALTQLAELTRLARPDGGFAVYPLAGESNPFASTVVLAALGDARSAGLSVDSAVFAKAKKYVARVLADPGAWKPCHASACKTWLRVRALDALAAAGEPSTSFLGDLYAKRDELDLADTIRLARLLVASTGYTVQAAQAVTSISDHIYETGANATVNVIEQFRWSGTPVVVQSQALRLFVARSMPPEQIDKLTRSLLAQRRNGTWGCTCENAEALAALTDVAEHEGRPGPFAVSGAFSGSPPPDGARWTLATQLTTTKRVSASHVAMGDVPRGPSSLSLRKQGDGVLRYAVTYTYRVSGPQPGQYAGLRVTRDVHPANTATVLATMGLLMPAQGVSLPAGNVYDVGLQIITDHPVDRVIIDDPLPAGMEAVNTEFKTATAAFVAQGDSWEISYQQIHHDRIEAYADRLGPGMYVLHYLVRTVTPGTYAWPGAQARLLNSPEEFGRSAATTLTVK